MLSSSSSRHVKSVRNGFEIVIFIQNHDGATINELSEHLNLAKSTVHNYLNTLESMGYVVNQDGIYHVGLRFLTHGMSAKNSLGIEGAVTEALSEIATEISQTIWWISEEHGRGVFVEQMIPDGQQIVYGRVGKRSYLHTHAPGKAILSELNQDYVESIVDHHGLPAYTDQTVTDKKELFDQLKQIRNQGYAFTDGETALGIQSIGVPFTDPDGRVHALGTFGYSHDFGGESLNEDITLPLQTVADDLIHSINGDHK